MNKIIILLLSASMLLIANSMNKEQAISKKELKISTLTTRVLDKQVARKCSLNAKFEEKAAKRLARNLKREAKLKALHEKLDIQAQLLATKSKKRHELKG